MKSFPIRTSGSATAVMVQTLDFFAICAGGWFAYLLRYSGSFEPIDMRSGDQILVLGLAVFSALFFGKIYRLWPGGSLGAMMGRATIGWVATRVLPSIKSATWSGNVIVGTVLHGDKIDLATLDAQLKPDEILEEILVYKLRPMAVHHESEGTATHYPEDWSLWMDLKIIFMTPLATFQNKNVY